MSYVISVLNLKSKFSSPVSFVSVETTLKVFFGERTTNRFVIYYIYIGFEQNTSPKFNLKINNIYIGVYKCT